MTEIQNVPLSVIKDAPFNPLSRTTKRALSNLRESIRKHGVLQPVTLTSDNYLADGHRRVACARELGIETIPAIYRDGTLSELWSELNIGTLAPRPKTWLEAVAAGMSIDGAPERIKRSITELIELVGEEGIDYYATLQRSPHIVRMVRYIANYAEDGTTDFMRATLKWLDQHQQQFSARRAIADGCPPDVLHDAIIKCQPLKMTWGV